MFSASLVHPIYVIGLVGLIRSSASSQIRVPPVRLLGSRFSRLSSFVIENGISMDTSPSSQANEVSFSALFPRGVRLDPVNFLEQHLQSLVEGLVFSTLVELADEVASGGQGVVAEGQCCVA